MQRPLQFTIRDIAFATFWLGACFAALGLARAGVVPSISFVLAVLALCAAVYAMFKNTPTDGPAAGVKAYIAAIVAWNVVTWQMALAYPHTIGRLTLVS